jgi:hypothetical protein
MMVTKENHGMRKGAGDKSHFRIKPFPAIETEGSHKTFRHHFFVENVHARDRKP